MQLHLPHFQVSFVYRGHQINAKITGAEQRERGLDQALKFEWLIDVDSLLSVRGFVFKILNSLSHLEVIGSRPRSQVQKRVSVYRSQVVCLPSIEKQFCS